MNSGEQQQRKMRHPAFSATHERQINQGTGLPNVERESGSRFLCQFPGFLGDCRAPDEGLDRVDG